METNTVKMEGRILLIHRDSNGIPKTVKTIKNVVTNVGLAQMAGLFNGVATTAFTYVAIGSSSASASASDTALGDELYRSAGTTSRTTTNVTDDTAVIEHTFDFTSSHTIREAGLFDADTGGNMACRQVLSDISVESGDSLKIIWKVTFS